MQVRFFVHQAADYLNFGIFVFFIIFPPTLFASLKVFSILKKI
jgi:hypothetical protein